MADLNYDGDIKMLRETLCVAQAAISQRRHDHHRKVGDIRRIQKLIDECDRHRPVGPDGKHGNLHTNTCGCEDKPPREQWKVVTSISAKRAGKTQIFEAVDEAIEKFQVGRIKMLVIIRGGWRDELDQLRAAKAYIDRQISEMEEHIP